MNKLKENILINTDFATNISGIGATNIKTIGGIRSHLLIDSYLASHNFQIVDENFPIPCDGILGLNFLREYNCILDYGKNRNCLIVKPCDIRDGIVLPISESFYPNSISLPARAQVVRRINLEQKGEILVPNQEIGNGIFIANTIVTDENPYVLMINTTCDNVFLKDVDIKTESMSDYDIVSVSPSGRDRELEIISRLSKNFPAFAEKSLTELCTNFTDIFALETDKITANNFYEQKLRISDKTPSYIKNYRIPHSQKDEITRQVEKLRSDDIVEPSFSAYNSPVLLVPKKSLPGSTEKRWRLVVDYRQINKKLVADKYPLPRIDDILDQLGRAKYFSCLDLMSGFHQIELSEGSRDITSFSTQQGSFRFKRLPYGIKVAPNSFQRMMSMAFSGLDPGQAFVYMDDLVVIGCSEKHMLYNLSSVFQLCRKYNLKLHPDKCQFFCREVSYLGHLCTDRGILPDSSKYCIIENYPKPKNADEVKRFVAFCNYYRRFIPNFATFSLFLTRLTRKNAKFEWTDGCENAFQHLRKSLLSPKILQYPDFEKKFCISTDASKYACGAVLSQEYGGVQLPVAYASRAFTKGESNKSVIEQELAAVHWAICHFRPYVYGKKFLVKSDHRPLTYLFSMKNPSSKLTRMRLDLEEYNFDIEYIKGKENCGPDALSRISFEDVKSIGTDSTIFKVTTRSDTRNKATQRVDQDNGPQNRPYGPPIRVIEPVTYKEIKKFVRLTFNLKGKTPKCYLKRGKLTLEKISLSDIIVNEKVDLNLFFSRLEKVADNNKVDKIQLHLNDEIFNLLNINAFKEKANKSLRQLRIYLGPKIINVSDADQKREILVRYHDDPISGGHPGVHRMRMKIRSKYFWTGMSKDIKNYVRKCELCQKNKSMAKVKEPMVLTETPAKAFDVLIIDTIGPFVRSDNGNEYALTMICDLTKYLVVVAIPDKSAKTVARAIFENFILIYGQVRKILSDMGTEYKNQTIEELSKLLNMEYKTSTAYHHQTLGTIERSHRTFNEYVRSYISLDRSDWDEWLRYFAYCFNTTPSTVHSYCPYELVFGKSPTIIEDLQSGNVDPIYNIDSYAKEVKYRMQLMTKRVEQMLERAKKANKANYDKTARPIDIGVGDLVLFEDTAGHKLANLYKGPYKVVSIDNRGNCSLILNNGKHVIIHKNRLRKYI